MTMLAVDSVEFGFGGTPVLRGVSMDVRGGDLVGILGPNGSGKTTLLRLMAGALAPQRGRVQVGRDDAAALTRRDIAQRLAVVPQDTHLAFDYTVLEIVLMGRYPHLGAFAIEGPADVAIAQAALGLTGTAHLAGRQFQTLSGGEKQRVIIASALAQLSEPAAADAGHALTIRAGALLLLDEPTASLDLRYQLEVASVLRRLHDQRDLTIVLSTHDLRFAASLCTRVVLLSRGRILAQGAPSEVLTAETVGQLYEIDAALAAPLVPA
jgi:iron complex transport system ATP-binding protein